MGAKAPYQPIGAVCKRGKEKTRRWRGGLPQVSAPPLGLLQRLGGRQLESPRQSGQKELLLMGSRNAAGGEPAPDAVPNCRYEAVAGVGEEGGKHSRGT